MSPLRSRLAILAAAVTLANGASAQDPESSCVSYGIDFQNDGSYFINQALTENFTAVSLNNSIYHPAN